MCNVQHRLQFALLTMRASKQIYLSLIIFSGIICTISIKWDGFLFFGRRKSEKNTPRKLIPKLIGNEDSCYLLEMVSDDCENCEFMEPIVERLEEDLQTEVRRINISRRREFLAALNVMGHSECGTFPFYYNRRTGQAICGATNYRNLRNLATGDLNHLFSDLPDELRSAEMEGPQRSGGVKGLFEDQFRAMEKNIISGGSKKRSKSD